MRLILSTASLHCPTSMLRQNMFSITPPRQELVLMRTTLSRSGESITQFSAKRFENPPDISEPTTMPPWPFFIRQLRTITFSVGVAASIPSRLRPLFMAMQSSPVSKKQSSISTFLQLSGSHPSPLGPSFCICTPRTVRFSQKSGWITQNGERNSVTSSISTFLHSTKLTSCGRIP